MNEIFSSRVLAVKFDLSRKVKVEIGNEEKKGSEGSVSGVGLEPYCRVIRERKSATTKEIFRKNEI